MTVSLWRPAYIALGSNLDQPARQVSGAIDELSRLPATRLVLRSSLYRSDPMGPQDQPDFVNAVVGVLTQASAEDLLRSLHDIEHRMGRIRAVHWGPRVIDLDLLMLGDQVFQSETLQLPHPGLMQRSFVLVPLAEIAPHLRLPNGRTAAQVAHSFGNAGLERLS